VFIATLIVTECFEKQLKYRVIYDIFIVQWTCSLDGRLFVLGWILWYEL